MFKNEVFAANNVYSKTGLNRRLLMNLVRLLNVLKMQ